MSKRKCFLVCNAHLDPVWLWPWEDGMVEAISTFRVAADFCGAHPEFIFNHNESLLYEWVERNDPELFERIADLVSRGRWHVTGGSYLQFDMIAAAGESLIRQFLIGKSYFQEKFGVEPTTAYNFDSFGHPQGLIQILAGCGYDSYVFCRPGRRDLELPVGSFRWRHRSGVEIIARRSDEHYCSKGNMRRLMKEYNYPEFFAEEGDFMYLWGIGNHGGGPSKDEYKEVKKLGEDWPDIEFIESTPEAFFEHSLRRRSREDLPQVAGDIKPTFEGCYTSMQKVKAAHRRMENLMHLTEKLAAMAWWRGRRDYPEQDLAVAWKDILFAEFHDVLPGSGIPSVEADSLTLLGHCQEILRRKKAEIIISLLRDESQAERNAAPIFVFNPHSWAVTQEVEVEYCFDVPYKADAAVPALTCRGRRVPLQREKPEHNMLAYDWRPKVCFLATVPPMSYRRFDASYSVTDEENIRRWKSPPLPAGDALNVRTDSLEVSVNLATGLIDSVRHGRTPILEGNCFRPLVMADIDHSWNTIAEWREPVGVFALASPTAAAHIIASDYVNPDIAAGRPPICIIEDGDIRTKVEVIFVHGGSYIVQHYTINKHSAVLHVEQTIFWAEHDKMLKLSVPHNPAMTCIEVEKCYSIDDQAPPAARAGREMDFQHSLRLFDKAQGTCLGVVSHGTHGYSLLDGNLRLSVLRSPAYATWEPDHQCDRYRNRYIPRHQQGLSHSRFTFVFGEQASSRAGMARAAYEHNVPLCPFVYFPTQRQAGPRPAEPFICVDRDNVLLTAMKKAHRGDDLVLRFWEVGGQDSRFTVTIDGKAHDAAIAAHRLATFRLGRDGRLVETDLLERPK